MLHTYVILDKSLIILHIQNIGTSLFDDLPKQILWPLSNIWLFVTAEKSVESRFRKFVKI